MKLHSLLLIAAVAFGFAGCNEKLVLTSPEGKLAVQLFQPEDGSGRVMMRIGLDGRCLMDSIGIGLNTDFSDWHNGLIIKAESDAKQICDDYMMPTGKRSHCVNYANECTYTLQNSEGRGLELRLRVYNDGVAFQYVLAEPQEGESVLGEYTAYRIPEGTRRWAQNYEPTGYEAFYPMAENGQKVAWKQRTRDWGYPVLIQPGSAQDAVAEAQDAAFMLITDANIRRGHCSSYLNNDSLIEYYKVCEADVQKTDAGQDWESPWRLLITGSLADIVASTLVTDVSDPSTIEDLSWIKPGPVAWIYWANNHGSQDYKIVTEYMDLAKAMGWQYNLIDAEWDLMGNGGTVEDALAYSRGIGIKSMIWYNSSTNWVGNGAPTPYWKLNKAEDREREFSWLEAQGAVGMKVDFFPGDKVEHMDYYIDLMEAAAAHRLMINFHGATIPRGWQRTYPNMMSMEAVYGAEWYNNAPTLTKKAAAHNATLPFTRNVIGPMDYTPGTFTDSQHPHITTYAHELALTVLFESALQHMPDRPSAYLEMPADVREFLSTLPAAWDDTKLLSGYPGDHAVIARRSGSTWYIAGINGTDEEKTLSFSLSSLQNHGSAAWTVTDAPGQDRQFSVSSETLTQDTVTITCRPRGGFIRILRE